MIRCPSCRNEICDKCEEFEGVCPLCDAMIPYILAEGDDDEEKNITYNID